MNSRGEQTMALYRLKMRVINVVECVGADRWEFVLL